MDPNPTLTPNHTMKRAILNRTLIAPQSINGFTLVELLIVIVILGVLGAVGIPSYLNQAGRARENAANQAAMAAAKACTSLRITGDAAAFEPMSGIAPSTCSESGATTFTSEIEGLTTQAEATVSDGGGVSLTQTAVAR
jgi:prepilin-type N-terminal cleavage/methylation domain-containing protein